MRQIYPDSGLIFWLNAMIVPSFIFRLFTNDVNPDRSLALAGLTEATWTGYAPITVTSTDFTLSGVAGHVGSKMAPPIAFANTSGFSQQAYGYYVTDSGNTVLLAAARFDSAPISRASGDFFNVIPIIGDFSEFSS